MATRRAQPELPRRVPAALLGALSSALALAPCAMAQDASGYQPARGEAFFLLSDKAYGSAETAAVRLEVAGRGYGMSEVERYGGVDVVVYRVPKPLPFLKAQANLQRVNTEAVEADDGLANALSYVWDRWVRASRESWRGLFSVEARRAVTAAAPEVSTSRELKRPTEFRAPPQFKPLKGFELVDRFRYPVHRATPIAPPKEVSLLGSSSEFIAPQQGNVMVPLGNLKPGLYLVEAYIGGFRANTLVFVSDTVAITKTAGKEMLVWTADRSAGNAVPQVDVVWTDGNGTLANGKTDKQGIARLTHDTPERSYVYGADPKGGVFISENFYYDSEIYDTKLYAVTDRPLYRPGDQVFVKFIGRAFQSARKSAPVAAGDIAITVFDPNGAPVSTQKASIAADAGADSSFRLPDNAGAGGYEIRFRYQANEYSAAFRVAEYQKPHFEIHLVPDRREFKTGQPVSGRLQLHYPDGKPVRDADVQLSVRAQQLTMVDGELRYYGQFPVKLASETLRTDAKGEARFELPAAEEPSRYVLTVFATDGAAYRVKTTKELLVERGQSAYAMRADRRFSAPNDTIAFGIRPVNDAPTKPATWEWVRLEDRKRASGKLEREDKLELTFVESGSYTVQLRDAAGNLVGAIPHWVSGAGLRAPAGSIEMVANKEKFDPGEIAEVLITFFEPVDEALFTLERDRVEQTALMRTGGAWVSATRIAPTQWRARIPIAPDFAPNITFSVAYVRNGDYVFQNQGLQVAQPRVEIELQTAKTVYAPGEKVEATLVTTREGKPVSATVAVGVVDEMIYVLQPEIAPDIYDFFYHPRRNNVRTHSSLSFIAYDLAVSRSRGAPDTRAVNSRRVKMLERPRREDVDTAYWQGSLKTDASGKAAFSFVMPDSLTRWRLTARAFMADGTVGQRAAWLRTDKDLYVKWTSPLWMRQGDSPIASIAAFNQTAADQKVELVVAGPGLGRTEQVTLKPGANFFAQPMGALSADGTLAVTLRRGGTAVDVLQTRFSRMPVAWRSPRTAVVPIKQGAGALLLPADARNIRVTLASSSAAQFSRIVDDLLEYPYGCVEQTASRMIPYALAIQSLGPQRQAAADRLRQQLNGQRLRLAYMAGPNAKFYWWGPLTAEDPLLTPYAYYADWMSTRALGIELPKEHWERLLGIYSDDGHTLPLVQRALILNWMQEIGLPVQTMSGALYADLQRSIPDLNGVRMRLPQSTSPLLAVPDASFGRVMAIALADRLARAQRAALPGNLGKQLDGVYKALAASGQPAAEALMIANGRMPASEAERVLASVRAEMPTMERAMTLAWIDQALGGQRSDDPAIDKLKGAWRRTVSPSGSVTWRWPEGLPVPTQVALPQTTSRPLTAMVQYESASAETPQLPATLERKLYRVVKGGEKGYQLEALARDAKLSTSELYLDEITASTTGKPLRYALLEAALPPGASVESTTWGISLSGPNGALVALERTRHEPTPYGYAVPIDPLASGITVRHLVRFAQKGSYVLPPARLYRMYQPELKAFESNASPRKLEIR